MRKAINFFRSYYDIAKELSDKDRLLFYDAILNKQFENIEPILTGMAKFAYLSQKHSIDTQIKGYYDKTKDEKFNPIQPPTVGAIQPPSLQVQEEEKEQVKEKEQVQLVEKNIKLSIFEYEKLVNEFTEPIVLQSIKFLSDYKIEKGYKTKNDNLTIRRWVIKAVTEQNSKLQKGNIIQEALKSHEKGINLIEQKYGNKSDDIGSIGN